MAKKKNIINILLGVALGLALALSGCSDSSSGGGSQPPQAAAKVWGVVDLGGFPLVGAQITISDLDGVVLSTRETATGPFGGFIFDVDQLPTDFNIQATGGTLDGEPFTGHARALVRDFTSGTWLPLNEVSTIVAAYADAHPEMTHEEVADVVAIYLGVPYYVSLEEVINTCDVYGGIFSPKLFSEAAKEAFGEYNLDSFVDIIISEIDEGEQHLFAAVDDYDFFLPPGVELWENNRLFPNVGSAAAAMKVAKVVFGVIEGLGQIVDSIFTEIYRNSVTEALTKIISQLNEIRGQLAGIQIQLEKLTFLTIKGQYDTRMTTINTYLTSIKNHIDELSKWAEQIPIDDDQVDRMHTRVLQIRDDILSTATGQGYANILANLSNAVANNDSTTPLMELRSMVMQQSLEINNSSDIDKLYLPFFQKLILRQLQGWMLYTHAYKHAYPDTDTAKDAYYTWRKTNLKWQVESFVRGAEEYALNHKNGDFYNQTFPCNDAYDSFFRGVDTFAEAVYPTFPKENENGYITGPEDGVLFVRLAFPVFPPPLSGNYLDPENNKYLVKLHQKQIPSWMDNPDQVFVNKEDSSDTHNLNQYISESKTSNRYTKRDIAGSIGFSSSTPTVEFYEPVKWVLGTFKIPTSSLGSTYTFDKTSSCLKKCAPHLYRGGNTEVGLRASPVLKFKYGWWSLQMAPSLETAIDTWHQKPDRVSHIWVDSGNSTDYKIYTALEKDQFNQRTDNLMLKYVGKGHFTVSPNSAQSSPYHVFCVDTRYPYPPNFSKKGYEVRARTDAFCLWEVMKHSASPDNDITKIIRLHATGYYDKLSEKNGWWIQGSGVWPKDMGPLYYCFLQKWGVWSGDHRSKLYPVKHGSEWLFD